MPKAEEVTDQEKTLNHQQVEIGDNLRLADDDNDKRLVISYKAYPNLKDRLKDLTLKANESHIGRTITNADIVDFALKKKFTESDFKEIRESVISPADFAKIALSEFNKKNNKNLSIYEFCAMQMKTKH